MHLIFDIGNVLVRYQPLEYLSRLFQDSSLIEKMYETIFKSKEWLLMDQGLLTFDEATDIFCKIEPKYNAEICKTMKSVTTMFTPLENTIKLLPELKEMGYTLYYLSNIQVEIRDYLLKNHDYFKFFTGGIFSCDINHIKPSPEIFQALLKKYMLSPVDCVFFDDMQENISAAEKEGIKGILFTSADCIMEYITQGNSSEH